MNPTLRQIRSFVALAGTSSFTRAADLLHLSQPALTVQIRQLEACLGVQLFDRNTRTVGLTRVGQELVPQFQRLQEEFDAVVVQTQDLAAGRRGLIRMACIPSFAASMLPGVMAAFRARNPHVAFSVKDANWVRVVSLLRAGEVDFGIGDSGSMLPDLEFAPIFEDGMRVIYPVGHAIGRMRRVTLAKLAEHPMVMMDPEAGIRATIDAAFARAACYPPRACEVMYMTTAIAMVSAGLGFSILPASAITLRLGPNVASKSVSDLNVVRNVGIIRRAGRSLPPSSEAFIQKLIGSKTRRNAPGAATRT